MTSVLWEKHKKDLLAKLSRDIPPPKAKVAKPALSFRKLKPGDRVRRNLDSKVFKVVLVDSLHAMVAEESPQMDLEDRERGWPKKVDCVSLGVDWELEFTKERKKK